MVQLSHLYMTTGKTIALTIQTFVSKVNNTLSRFIIAFLPRSKHLLISWLQSLSAAILEPKKIKSVAVSTFSPTYLPWSDGTGCLGLRFFECWVLSHLFHSYTLINMLFSSSSLSAIRVVSSAYLRLLTFLPEILIPAFNSSVTDCFLGLQNHCGWWLQPWN